MTERTINDVMEDIHILWKRKQWLDEERARVESELFNLWQEKHGLTSQMYNLRETPESIDG